MARQARKKSRTGIYHLMHMGINHQSIFEDEEDFQKYIETLKKYQEISGYIIYAYCLMDNHLHLLIKEGEEDLGVAFKRIGSSFVYWYNWKYERRGPLFQGRYKTEVVDNDEYFQVVIRYIHQNPLKAGMVENINDYKWSSYNEYINESKLCNIDFPLDMLSNDRAKAINQFKQYNNTKNDDQCLDYDNVKRLKDSEARKLISELTGFTSTREIANLEKEKRKEAISLCKKAGKAGMSIRQISRLTGVSLGVVRGIWDKTKKASQGDGPIVFDILVPTSNQSLKVKKILE